MARKAALLYLMMFFFALAALPGCPNANQEPTGRVEKGKNSRHYLRKYAEKEMQKKYAAESGTRVELGDIARAGRNWRAEVIIEKDGVKQRKNIVADRKGRVISERGEENP